MTNHADDGAVQEAAARAVQSIVWDHGTQRLNHIALAKAAGLVSLLQHAAGMGIEAATTQLGLMGRGGDECSEKEAEEKRRERARYVFCGEMPPLLLEGYAALHCEILNYLFCFSSVHLSFVL